MKFYFFIAVVMSSVASADYIRKTFVEPVVLGGKGFSRVLEKKAAYGGEEVFGARIHIGGLLEAPTKEELDVLDQVLPEAFNAAHASIGFKMDNSTSKTTLSRRRDEVDHDFMIIAEFTVQWNGGFCKLCTLAFSVLIPLLVVIVIDNKHRAHPDVFVTFSFSYQAPLTSAIVSATPTPSAKRFWWRNGPRRT